MNSFFPFLKNRGAFWRSQSFGFSDIPNSQTDTCRMQADTAVITGSEALQTTTAKELQLTSSPRKAVAHEHSGSNEQDCDIGPALKPAPRKNVAYRFPSSLSITSLIENDVNAEFHPKENPAEAYISRKVLAPRAPRQSRISNPRTEGFVAGHSIPLDHQHQQENTHETSLVMCDETQDEVNDSERRVRFSVTIHTHYTVEPISDRMRSTLSSPENADEEVPCASAWHDHFGLDSLSNHLAETARGVIIDELLRSDITSVCVLMDRIRGWLHRCFRRPDVNYHSNKSQRSYTLQCELTSLPSLELAKHLHYQSLHGSGYDALRQFKNTDGTHDFLASSVHPENMHEPDCKMATWYNGNDVWVHFAQRTWVNDGDSPEKIPIFASLLVFRVHFHPREPTREERAVLQQYIWPYACTCFRRLVRFESLQNRAMAYQEISNVVRNVLCVDLTNDTRAEELVAHITLSISSFPKLKDCVGEVEHIAVLSRTSPVSSVKKFLQSLAQDRSNVVCTEMVSHPKTDDVENEGSCISALVIGIVEPTRQDRGGVLICSGQDKQCTFLLRPKCNNTVTHLNTPPEETETSRMEEAETESRCRVNIAMLLDAICTCPEFRTSFLPIISRAYALHRERQGMIEALSRSGEVHAFQRALEQYLRSEPTPGEGQSASDPRLYSTYHHTFPSVEGVARALVLAVQICFDLEVRTVHILGPCARSETAPSSTVDPLVGDTSMAEHHGDVCALPKRSWHIQFAVSNVYDSCQEHREVKLERQVQSQQQAGFIYSVALNELYHREDEILYVPCGPWVVLEIPSAANNDSRDASLTLCLQRTKHHVRSAFEKVQTAVNTEWLEYMLTGNVYPPPTRLISRTTARLPCTQDFLYPGMAFPPNISLTGPFITFSNTRASPSPSTSLLESDHHTSLHEELTVALHLLTWAACSGHVLSNAIRPDHIHDELICLVYSLYEFLGNQAFASGLRSLHALYYLSRQTVKWPRHKGEDRHYEPDRVHKTGALWTSDKSVRFPHALASFLFHTPYDGHKSSRAFAEHIQSFLEFEVRPRFFQKIGESAFEHEAAYRLFCWEINVALMITSSPHYLNSIYTHFNTKWHTSPLSTCTVRDFQLLCILLCLLQPLCYPVHSSTVPSEDLLQGSKKFMDAIVALFELAAEVWPILRTWAYSIRDNSHRRNFFFSSE